MAEITNSKELVDIFANEVSLAVEKAVDCWMSQIEDVLGDVKLTSFEKLQATRAIIGTYKRLTGKSWLECHRVA